MRTWTAPHPGYDAVVVEPGVTNEQLDAIDFPDYATSSVYSFTNVPIRDRVLFSVSTTTGGHGYRFVGMLCVEIRLPSSSNRNYAIIHSLVVDSKSRGGGVATAMLSCAHNYVCVEAMKRLASATSVKSSGCHSLQWILADGSCRRRPETLLFLHKKGWRVVLDGEKLQDQGTLSTWLSEGKDMSRTCVDILGPESCLEKPLLLPWVPLGMALFKPSAELPPLPMRPIDRSTQS